MSATSVSNRRRYPSQLEQAFKLHMAGKLAAAARAYAEILTHEPGNADTLHLFGVLHLQRGDYGSALRLIERAVAIDDCNPAYHESLGRALRKLGRDADAIDAFQRAIALNPGAADTYILLGMALARQNRFEEAIAAYLAAIELAPQSVEAHINLGNACLHTDQFGRAQQAYSKALATKPDAAEAHFGLGKIASLQRDLAASVAHYRDAVRLSPGYADAQYNLSTVLYEQGARRDVLPSLERAVELRPAHADAHCLLAAVYDDLDRPWDAIKHYHLAVERQPDHVTALTSLAKALSSLDAGEQALEFLRRAAKLAPASVEILVQIGNVQMRMRESEQAIETCGRALELAPEHAGALNLHGWICMDQLKLQEAEASMRSALALQPDSFAVLGNLANLHMMKGNLDEARACYDRVLAIEPDNPDAHQFLALWLLKKGQLAAGWREYEWRWQASQKAHRREFTQPQWRGEDVARKTVLLHCEQGYGDSIQMIRYAQMLARRGARVIVECPAPLVRLFSRVGGVASVIKRDDPLPGFDLQCPLMSLPLAFDTRLETIPGAVPYLAADEAQARQWRAVITAGGRINAGLVWAGSSTYKSDQRRSLEFRQLAAFAAIEGVNFYSLQKGGAAGQAAHADCSLDLADYTDRIDDFADTAALIENLDLVISVDTSVAHLAGAMGKPVWMLDRFSPDWRWLLDREDSPWYPTMRIFRQPRVGDWQSVIDRVADELRRLVNSRDQEETAVNGPDTPRQNHQSTVLKT